MLIQVLTEDASHIVHSKGVSKVVKGIADVPDDVAKELLAFGHLYTTVKGKVEQEVLDALAPKPSDPKK